VFTSSSTKVDAVAPHCEDESADSSGDEPVDSGSGAQSDYTDVYAYGNETFAPMFSAPQCISTGQGVYPKDLMFQWTMPEFATDVGIAVVVTGMSSLSPIVRASWIVLDVDNDTEVLGSGTSTVTITSLGSIRFIADGLTVTGLRTVYARVLFIVESAAGLYSPQQSTVPVELDLFTVLPGGVVQGDCSEAQMQTTMPLTDQDHVDFLPRAYTNLLMLCFVCDCSPSLIH
jgi:hypothetical protein